MMALHEHDEEEAALITKRIGLGFDFVKDVLDFPGLLELIPDKSRLVMRDLHIGQMCIRLVAYAFPDRLDRWEARLTAPTWLSREMNGDLWAGDVEDTIPAGEFVGFDPPTAPTAEDALDALEAVVRSTVSAEKLRASV